MIKDLKLTLFSARSSSEYELTCFINIEKNIMIRVQSAEYEEECEVNDAGIGLNKEQAIKLKNHLEILINKLE